MLDGTCEKARPVNSVKLLNQKPDGKEDSTSLAFKVDLRNMICNNI